MYEFLLWTLVVASTHQGDKAPKVLERFTSLEKCVAYQKNLPPTQTIDGVGSRSYTSRCIEGYVLIPGATGPGLVKVKP